MRITIAQIDIVELDPTANFKRLEAVVSEAAERSADYVVLPETWSTGYDLPRAQALAGRNAQLVASIQDLAKRHGVGVIGSLVLPNPGDRLTRNEALVVGPDGKMLLRYAKSHLIDLSAEKDVFAAGRQLPVIKLGDAIAAVAICYDLRFPELFRHYMRRGVGLFFVVAEWPVQRVSHWEALLRARAIENQAFVVACNRVGADANDQYGGRSQVIDPWGVVQWRGSADGEVIMTCDIDLSLINSVRAEYPFLADSWIDVGQAPTQP